jgi:hypothetical protein
VPFLDLWHTKQSLDTMITSGPINEVDLRGSALLTKSTALQSSQSNGGSSLVRFNLDYEGKEEVFIYPADQCEWYFVSRHRSCLSR